jgi:hypothetical protein
MGELYPARMVGHAHHIRKLACGQGLRQSAGLDREGGRRLDDHWAGASLRFDEHEFKAKTTLWQACRRQSAGLADHACRDGAVYAKAEDKMGVTRTNGIPACRQQQFQGAGSGCKKLGYKTVHTGNMAINSEPREGRGSCQQIGFCFQGCKSGAKWSTLYTEIPRARRPEISKCAPTQVIKIEHDASGKVTGVVYADETGDAAPEGAVVAVAGNSIESPRLLLNQRLECSRTGLPTRRAGRPQLHAAHDGQRSMPHSKVGAHVSRHHHGRHHPRRGAQRPQTRIRRRL